MIRPIYACVLALLCCTNVVTAQSPFLFGMYAIGRGENEGMHWTGSRFDIHTAPDGSGRRLMNFWNDSLGMNTFFVNVSNFGDNRYVDTLFERYAAYPSEEHNFIAESKIIPIYRCFQFTHAAESHYLKFSPASQRDPQGNGIVFDNSTFDITTGDSTFTISATRPLSSGRIIQDLTVFGGETRQLRPRDWNTRGASAHFTLRFRFSAGTSSPRLRVILDNKGGTTGNTNYHLIDTILTPPAGNSTMALPFRLDTRRSADQHAAHTCKLRLQVYCSMPAGSVFHLNDITAYDDSGRVVVEETDRFSEQTGGTSW